jgi:hypothetical protein
MSNFENNDAFIEQLLQERDTMYQEWLFRFDLCQ